MKLLKPKKFKIKKIIKDQKTIRVIEKGEKFDFFFQRNYIINNHNINNFSGFHAHKKLYQLVFCIRGKVEIVCSDNSTGLLENFKIIKKFYSISFGILSFSSK